MEELHRDLEELHQDLCHPGIPRLLYFVRTKNLPFSATNMRRDVSNCKTYAKVKPRYYGSDSATLIKATRSMERISLDFQDPLSSSRCKTHLLIVFHEYSRLPLSRVSILVATVICSLDKLFILCGSAGLFIPTMDQLL